MSGRSRKNRNAGYVDSADFPVPICPKWAAVRNAIDRHRDGLRKPVKFEEGDRDA